MTRPPKKRWLWRIVAAVLLGLGAWLMSGAEPPVHVAPEISLPRRMSRTELGRNVARQTWVAPERLDDAGVAVPRTDGPRDPVLAAMPSEVKYAAVVVEANAIRNSAVGDLLIDCMFAGRPEMLEDLRDAGLDPLNGVDRVAMADRTMMVSGDFSRADLKSILGAESSQQWGKHSTLYTMSDGQSDRTSMAGVWNNQMLVVGRDAAEVKATLDRLDGVGGSGPSVLKPENAYGEMYGTLTGAGLARMLGDENPELAKIITEAAGTVNLHADVSRDVGLVADIEGSDPKKTEELRKSLGSALTLARLQAKAEGRTDEVSVLDLAKVGTAEEGTAFRLEAGLPFSFLEKNLKACAEKGRDRRARRLDAGLAPNNDDDD